MIRPLPIRRYLSVMSAKGFSIDEVLHGSAIDTEALDDPDYLVDVGQYRRVVDNMIALTGGEGLGLDVGLQREVGDFGILGYAAMSCQSVRQSVEEFWGQYGDALGMMAQIRLPNRKADLMHVDIVAASISPATYRFFVEEVLCILLTVGAQVSGVKTEFVALELSYPPPRYATRYRSEFACPITFNAQHTRVTLSRDWFEAPLKTCNIELVRLYKQHLTEVQHKIEAGNPLHVRLRHLFVRRNGDIPPLDEAARELQLSPRTFRRQLQQQNLSYRKVIAEYRTELSLEYVRTGNVATKVISDRLGFDDVNAFRRAFKKWTGKTVRSCRMQ